MLIDNKQKNFEPEGEPDKVMARREVAAICDVTQRTKLDQDQAQALLHLDTLLTYAPFGFVFIDRDLRFVRINDQLAEINGYSVAAHIGRTVAEIVPSLEATLREVTARIVATGQPVLDQEFTGETARAPGITRTWNESWYPVRDESGEIVGFSAMVVDITERKRIELNLIEAIAVAEKASRAKSDFLTSMSHELRTPLNSILGFAQLLESGASALTPFQRRNLEQIVKAGWYLVDLVNELLDLAQIESGKLTLTQAPVSLAEVMLECQAIIEPQALQRGISITFPALELLGDVRADRTRVKQVLINLLSNAIKYNKAQGAVSVEYALRPPDAIRVCVRDTGEGLAPEKLAQLFQAFNRLGKEAGPEQGTGIGLVMSRHLIELMGGAIGADSEVGVGSVFWFELKCASSC